MLIRCILVVLALSSCQVYEAVCPKPDHVRARRAYANKMRKQRMKLWAEANIHQKYYDAGEREEYKPMDGRFLEIWDCPKPGTKQDKRREARRIKALKKYAAELRKRVDKEDHTLDPFAERED